MAGVIKTLNCSGGYVLTSGTTGGTVDTADVTNDAVTFAKMQNVSAASRLLGRGSAGGSGDVEEISISTGLTLTGTTLTATSSVDGSGGSTGLTLTGGPITGSGTLVIGGCLGVGSGGTGATSMSENRLVVGGAMTSTSPLVSLASGTSGQYLKSNGSSLPSWDTVTSSPVGSSLGSGNLWIGDVMGAAASVAMSGDTTITSAGVVAIGNDKVTYAKMQNVSAASRLLGRGSASGSGDTEEISFSGFGLTMFGTSLRADFGTTSTTICVGDDGRLSDARTPVGTSLTSGNVWIGNGSNLAASVSLSGDITTTNAGVTAIGNDKVTYAKMQNVSAASKLLGRGSAGGSGDPEEITLSGLSMSGTTLSPVAQAIGSTLTSGTTGSVLFVGSGPVFAQDNANLFWNDSNNRLGVGTASPGQTLEVYGTDASIQISKTNAARAFVFLGDSTSASQTAQRIGSDGDKLELYTGATRRITIDSAGLVGIGNVSPTSLLHLSSTAPTLTLTDTTASAKSLTMTVDGNLANFRESAGASGSLLVLDLANNRFGVGTAAPSKPVHFSATDTTVSGAASLRDMVRINAYTEPTGDTQDFYTGLYVQNQTNTGNSFNYTGSGGGLYGCRFDLDNYGTGTVNTVTGVLGKVVNRNTGTITSASCYEATIQGATAAGTITTAYGLKVNTPTVSGGSIITASRGVSISNQGIAGTTTSYGLVISAQSGSTTNYGIFCSGGFNVLQAGAASTIPLTVQGAASQSGNLQEWVSSGSTVLSTISENGYFTTRKTSAPADAELATGELALWFDSTAGAAKLMIKAKNASGTVVTGNVALA